MKILKTAQYKKTQMDNKTVDLYARYIGDGYLAYAEYASNPNVGSQGDKYWPDYYDSDHDIGESDTVLLKDVPIDIAKKLVEQGGSNQWYDDGYEAASVAAPYVKEDDEEIDDRIMDTPTDTPMGFEDDNLSDLDL